MNRFLLSGIGACMAFPAVAVAQPAYNIDFGNAATAPNAAYGAASGQAGCWTAVNAAALTALRTLGACLATADTIIGTGGVLGAFNHPNTVANHQRHMDDWVNLGPAGTLRTYTVTLNTLAVAQWYAVWTYSWGSQPGMYSSVNVDVVGSIDPPVLVADWGVWPAGVAGAAAYTLWQHFSYHEVQVMPGGAITIDLTVDAASAANGRLNGIQIVPIAGPDPATPGDGIPPNPNP